MFLVLPDDPNRKEAKTEKVSKIDKFLQGTYSNPFGFYDFVIVLTATFWYFFFTGFAVLLGRNIPRKWVISGSNINNGKILTSISNKVFTEKKVNKNKSSIETLNEKPETRDLLKS